MIATGGRATIAATFQSLIPQLCDGDEIIVVRRDCNWGHQARNDALPRCAGTHILFMDDDDTYTDNALETIRQALLEAPDRVHLFAMQYPDGNILQPAWPLQIGYVSTQMIVVPNQPGKLGAFGDRYEGDHDFAASTVELRGDTPDLHPDVIALVRPAG